MIELIFIIALFCNGLQIISSERMILFPVKVWLVSLTLKYNWLDTVYKPLILCIKCMASFWGVALSLIWLPFTISLFWQIPVVCVCAACLNAIVYQLYDNPNISQEKEEQFFSAGYRYGVNRNACKRDEPDAFKYKAALNHYKKTNA